MISYCHAQARAPHAAALRPPPREVRSARPAGIPARPRLGRVLEVLHKLLTGGAALGTILRLLF